MKRMILIDGNSLMYRAFFGMSPESLRANSKGLYTNAIFAFARMINNLIKKDYDYMCVCFDKGKHTFRHDILDTYKAGRAHMPDEMRCQIPYIKEYLKIMNISQYEIDLYEADDIIATLNKYAKDKDIHVDIYSSDKDLLQLIDTNTFVHLTKKGMSELEDFDINHFNEVYGIKVSQFIDLKAMMGDKSDNLIGIPGIGEKTAIKLLCEYKSLEDIFNNIDNIKGALQQKLISGKETGLLTKRMVIINDEAPIEITLDDIIKKEPDLKKLKEFYDLLEIKSLSKELELNSNDKKEINIDYKIVNDLSTLNDILIDYSTIYIETFDSNYHKEDILAIALSNKKGNFIIDKSLLGLSLDLELFLTNPNNHKSTFDIKKTTVLLKRLGLDFYGVDFDLMLASYIYNPNLGNKEFKDIVSYFDYNETFYEEEIYNKGAKKSIPSIDKVYSHAITKAIAISNIKEDLLNKLNESNQIELLNDIEIPLAFVLADMEFRGIKIDKEELLNQEKSLINRINYLEEEIYSLSGEKFNISSPKQLGVILFEKLNLACPKKTKTGYSTDANVLDSLIDKHPIIKLISDYRALTKLYSTYIEGLKKEIYEDGKVHTIYEQALTQTGRLSSVEPNLQNIPIRTEDGKNIRKMFIPQEGYKLFSSDYSQIELRVLAHLANVKLLIEAFNNNEDIHAKTAQEIFNKKEITSDERRKAKAVNFGIIYGISAYGLSTDLKIETSVASMYINRYFEIYPEIKEYMENTLNFCKENGFVYTIKNRKRYIPDINSSNYNIREFAKRTAMNAPVQGSAADIMKIAMIDVYNEIHKKGLKSHMLLQVHDEIVLEVYNGEEDIIKQIVEDKMKNAIKLSVNLDVDSSFGNNWYEVK